MREYSLSMRFCTDGDYGFDFVPVGMTFDGMETYDYEEEFDNEREAYDKTKKICAFLKANIRTSRDYVRRDLETMFDDFLCGVNKSEKENREQAYVSRGLFGNYCGTELQFVCKEPRVCVGNIQLTEEEYALVEKAKLTRGEYKDVLLEACRRKLNKTE